MAARPKSPRSPKTPDKDESIWDKIGTLGRKKRIKEGTKHVHCQYNNSFENFRVLCMWNFTSIYSQWCLLKRFLPFLCKYFLFCKRILLFWKSMGAFERRFNEICAGEWRQKSRLWAPPTQDYSSVGIFLLFVCSSRGSGGRQACNWLSRKPKCPCHPSWRLQFEWQWAEGHDSASIVEWSFSEEVAGSPHQLDQRRIGWTTNNREEYRGGSLWWASAAEALGEVDSSQIGCPGSDAIWRRAEAEAQNCPPGSQSCKFSHLFSSEDFPCWCYMVSFLFLQTLGFHHKTPKWTVESVHSKNLVAILHLLVALVRHFRAPVRLPDNVYVTVVIVQKNGTQLSAQWVHNILLSHTLIFPHSWFPE